ncbi:OsmC/Ohr family [Globomyces pollinis-pini]|nr:OsmC/Ohr family [Globomyces pollinis-pini]
MMVIKNIRMLRVKTPVMTRAMSFKPVYVANVTSTGGRNGKSVSDDKVIKLDLAVPKEMGGPGGAKTNPEQLFAAGYSACFLGAMGAMARDQKLKLPAETTCNALIGIGADPAGGF